MSHITIEARCKSNGDAMTAISELCRIVKAYGNDIRLIFPDGIVITVRPTSEVMDLCEIYSLESKLLLGGKKQ